jgi:anthranilate synthase/aminodeoxychorismate synthase-like glutamine amidotransferase
VRVSDQLTVVMVDNFDSFTYNLVDELARRECAVEVWRNTTPADQLVRRAERANGPSLIVMSPGPGHPRDAGCCLELVRLAAGRVPLFGVCLGHQAIVEAFGGIVAGAGEILHGKASPVCHEGHALFDGVPSPFPVGRYHSLAARTVPSPLAAIAWSGDLVMALAHETAPVFGVQFHPESILTPDGGRLIENVIAWATQHSRGDDGR